MRISLSAKLLVSYCLCLLGSNTLAQHETGSDVLSGQQAFQNLCANCHGVAGNQIAGVDLGHGTFRQPYSDDELRAIVLNGIPGKAMPANPTMTVEQATQIVAYLRSRATQQDAAAGGNAERGKALFAGKGECYSCHRIAREGSRLGPELDGIGLLRTSDELAASLLEPGEKVQPNHRFYSVTTKDGREVTGRLLNQDAFTVQLLDTDEQLRSFMKTDLQTYAFAPSPMPSLRGEFDDQELADLVQYLVTLRGAE
ncbi:MAG: c-type cytochrome [Pseudomonadota bacterium]